MRVVFVLPRWSRVPIGGYRIVYEHARGLAARGHDVEVVHWAPVSNHASVGVAAEAARRLREGRWTTTDVPWLRTDEAVVTRSVLRLPRGWPDADAVVATSWQTAEAVAARVQPERGFALMQSYETWSGPMDRVDATWRGPLHPLVIAHWLADKAAELGVHEVDLVPNFVDDFFLTDDAPDDEPVERDPHRVAMLWHPHPVKGSRLGLDVLARARRRVPALRAGVFSVARRPAGIPEWVEWHRTPSRAELRTLLRSSAVFLSPSTLEGWALPPAEAMASGCALVATDIGGHHDYAVQRQTALLAPAEDAEGLAAAVVHLLAQPTMARDLADAGRRRIACFSRRSSVDAMERALLVRTARAGRPTASAAS